MLRGSPWGRGLPPAAPPAPGDSRRLPPVQSSLSCTHNLPQAPLLAPWRLLCLAPSRRHSQEAEKQLTQDRTARLALSFNQAAANGWPKAIRA